MCCDQSYLLVKHSASISVLRFISTAILDRIQGQGKPVGTHLKISPNLSHRDTAVVPVVRVHT